MEISHYNDAERCKRSWTLSGTSEQLENGCLLVKFWKPFVNWFPPSDGWGNFGAFSTCSRREIHERESYRTVLILPTLLPPANEVFGQGNVFTRVCHSVHRGRWFASKGGLHQLGFASRGGLHLEGVGRPIPQSDTVNERAVPILLECILVLPYICNFLHYYHLQRSCGKVMCSQASVKNSVHRGLSARHLPGRHTTHPLDRPTPWADTPRQITHTPPPRQTPHPTPRQQTATAVDGMHPTWVHSYLHHMMLVNVKLDVSRHNRLHISRLQILLVFLMLNGTAKMKLAILAFLYCGEIVKNSIKDPLNMYFLFFVNKVKNTIKSDIFLNPFTKILDCSVHYTKDNLTSPPPPQTPSAKLQCIGSQT